MSPPISQATLEHWEKVEAEREKGEHREYRRDRAEARDLLLAAGWIRDKFGRWRKPDRGFGLPGTSLRVRFARRKTYSLAQATWKIRERELYESITDGERRFGVL